MRKARLFNLKGRIRGGCGVQGGALDTLHRWIGRDKREVDERRGVVEKADPQPPAAGCKGRRSPPPPVAPVMQRESFRRRYGQRGNTPLREAPLAHLHHAPTAPCSQDGALAGGGHARRVDGHVHT